MRFSLLPVGAATLLMLADPVSVSQALADDAETCVNGIGDGKIVACTSAINSGRWQGSGLAWAYNNRGNAYNDKGDNDRAIADYDQAIQLDPQYAFAYHDRGNAYHDKGDNDRAIADYNQAIQLDLKDAVAYFDRGRVYLYADLLPKALADINQASALNPKDAYAALWLDIVNKRSNLPSRLAETAAQINMTEWPAPVIRLYLGQMTPEAVLAAADNPNAETKNGRICEANFYTGEMDLQQGKKDDATRLFRRAAAADCPKSFIEYEGAVAELKALGVKP
jgi:lipoprotein NlpI